MGNEVAVIALRLRKIDLSLPAPMARQRSGDIAIYKAPNDLPHSMKPLMPQKWAFLEEARHFVECIRDKKPTISPASEGVKDLEISEQYVRCLMSSREGKYKLGT